MKNSLRVIAVICSLATLLLLFGCQTGMNDASTGGDGNTDNVISIDESEEPIHTAGPSAEPTFTPELTAEPSPTPLVDPNPDFPYYLYVEKGSYTLTIYGKDDNFEYTVVVAQYRIAHGGNKTPVGTFKLTSTKYRWYTFRLGGSVQYATAYYGNLYIHSPLYGSEQPWNLWPTYYNGQYGIGTDHTGGCLRMVTEAAKFIYDNCPVGTTLEIVNGSPRGTTSPDVPRIITYGYDPTDYEATGGGN